MSYFLTSEECGSETHLWDQFVRTGDRKALRCIYSSHARLLYNYGMHITHHQDLVKDCIQDLFLDLLKHHSNLSKTSSIKFYLYKALRRKIIHEEKKIARQLTNQETFNETDEKEVFHEFSDMVDRISALQNEKILKSVQSLPKRQQEVIQLIFFENLSRGEVSEILEIDANYLYTITWKAIKSLRKSLKQKDLIIHLIHLLPGLQVLL